MGRNSEQLAELRRALGELTTESASGTHLRRIVEGFAQGFDAGVMIHRPQLTPEGWATELEQSSDHPLIARFAAQHEAFLPEAPLRYGRYDPLLVEASERNRVVPASAMRAILVDAPEPLPVVTGVYEPAGVLSLSHTRVVLTDGPFMLAWFGLFRADPFTSAEEQLIADLVPGVATRLSIERLLWGGAPGSFDAVGQTLELIGRPAFVVNAAGQLVFVNAAARDQIDRDRSIIDDVTDAAMNGTPSTRVHSVTRVGAPGAHGHSIVLAGQTELAAETRLARVANEHGLTETQLRVLALLVRGDANKDIATKLRCAPRTVELHVTAILKKCRVESRARLIAWFWTRI